MRTMATEAMFTIEADRQEGGTVVPRDGFFFVVEPLRRL